MPKVAQAASLYGMQQTGELPVTSDRDEGGKGNQSGTQGVCGAYLEACLPKVWPQPEYSYRIVRKLFMQQAK